MDCILPQSKDQTRGPQAFPPSEEAKSAAPDHLPPFDQEEYANDLRNRNRENKDTIDPDTGERVILLTRKQLEEFRKRLDKGLGRF